MAKINTMKNMFSALIEEQGKDYAPSGVVSMDTSSVLEDFPEIGTSGAGGFGTAGFGKKNKKKKFTYIVSNSLIDELKGKKDAVFTERTTAFETIESKSGIEKRLHRTKMCKSVADGTTCPHGERCRFAHNADELEVAVCVFGDVCKFTRFVNGCYVNSNRRRICKFKHTNESNEDFFERTGMTPKKPIVESAVTDTIAMVETTPVFKSKPQPVELPTVVDDWMQHLVEDKSPIAVKKVVAEVSKEPGFSNMSRGFKAREAAKLCDTIKTGKTSVIRVYKELAVEAFQMMMDCGMTNIRFEII